jgi:chromosome segregation ATPase
VSLLGIARSHGRHRGATVRELHQRIAALQVSRRELKAAMARLAAENHQLQRQLDGAGWGLEEAQREIGSLRAALANATSASDLHLHQAVMETQPIPVITLAEAARKGDLK